MVFLMAAGAGYTVYSLGDQALVIDYGNRIDEQVNRRVLQIFNQFRLEPLPGIIEVVPAYSSLTFYYDVAAFRGTDTAFEQCRAIVEPRIATLQESAEENGRLLRVPACYDPGFGTDLKEIAALKQISMEEIVREHCTVTYRVYMLGFLPGFAYMGTVNERLALPRKDSPARVKAGSIGIAGRQTGIYPFDSPGGWQIIGRTPLKLFDSSREEPAYFRAGDRVQFFPVSKEEFRALSIKQDELS
ncbi:MAG TPA: 5-oxoprolinase subunit PxpB [Chitinophagaceae bacterium]|nr:5-oxoprolinase subunit PxpB [Chitinophagaceae bacterium]